MENETATNIGDGFLAELARIDKPEPLPRINPTLKIRVWDRAGTSPYLYREGDRWGIAVGDETELYLGTPAIYDEVFPLGGRFFIARQEVVWYVVLCCELDYPPTSRYGYPFGPYSLEGALRYVGIRTSHELAQYDAAQSAVTADEIEDLEPGTVLYRHGDRWGLGYRDNKFLARNMVIPDDGGYDTRGEAFWMWANRTDHVDDFVPPGHPIEPVHSWQDEGF